MTAYHSGRTLAEEVANLFVKEGLAAVEAQRANIDGQLARMHPSEQQRYADTLRDKIARHELASKKPSFRTAFSNAKS
jgi:hypothetical protein